MVARCVGEAALAAGLRSGDEVVGVGGVAVAAIARELREFPPCPLRAIF